MVHVIGVDFNPIDVLDSPEPEQNIQSRIQRLECARAQACFNTHICSPSTKDLAAYSTKHQMSRIVDGIRLRMLQSKGSIA